MGLTVFPFTMRGDDLDEKFEKFESTSGPAEGPVFRRLRANKFSARQGFLLFPDTIANASYKDFDTYWEETLLGGIDSYLYAARNAVYRQVVDDAVGTSTGGAGQTFAARHKFLNAGTLVVKVSGTPTTEYSLSGNNTAPIITTTAGFPAGPVTFDYDFYWQVFGYKLRTANLVQGPTLASPGTQKVWVEMIQNRSGGHLA